jgi:hypothetical protein
MSLDRWEWGAVFYVAAFFIIGMIVGSCITIVIARAAH